MSDDAQNPGGSDGTAPQAGGGKPGLARKPLVRAGGLGRKAGGAAAGGESSAPEPSESAAATDAAGTPPPAAPVAAPGPAVTAPSVASVRAGEGGPKDAAAADQLLAKAWANGNETAALAYKKSHVKSKK